MKPLLYAFGFVALTLFVGVGYLVYNFIVFFQPDKIVGGTAGILTAIGAITLAAYRFIPTNIPETFGRAVVLVNEHLRTSIAAALAVWAAIIVWSIIMWGDVVGRFVYVNSLQRSMENGEYDRASLPDSALLAKAFIAFPNRREVPFLLARSSRLLFQANRRDLFREFQSRFLAKLEPEIDIIIAKLCDETKSRPATENLIFLTSTASEAAAFERQQGLPQAEAIKMLERFVGPLSKCGSSFEARVQRIRLLDTINDLTGASTYNIATEMQALDQDLSKSKDDDRILRFWQSHAAQEYLDFKAYKIFSDVNSRSKAQLDEAVSYFETLLLLRQSSARAGEVIWNVTPFKLNVFPAFMIAADLKSLAYKHQIAMFEATPAIANAIKPITERKAFEAFRTPGGWYASTPLDFQLNGSAVTTKVNNWLKEDW